MAEAVHEVLAGVSAAVDALVELDVAALSVEQAERVLAVLGAVEQRLAAKRLQVLPVAQAGESWARDGSRSFAHHLARVEGRRLSSARAEVRLAARVGEHLPLSQAAVLRGELGLEHLREMARVADTDKRRRLLADRERGEALLLAQAAGLSVEQFAVVVSAWAYRADPDAEDERYRQGRDHEHLHLSETLGGWALRGWLSPDSGQLLRAALDAVGGRPAADDDRTPSQRDGGAVCDMARMVLDSGQFGSSAVVRPHLSVHVDFDTLRRLAEGRVMDGAQPARLDDGSPIPAWLLETIACDCQLTRIVFGPRSQVLDVGRTRRTFTSGQRRAIVARDRQCVWPSCNAPPSRCQAHHLREWGEGGATDLGNGALLCWHHHEYLHRQRLRLRRQDAGWVLTHADGRRFQRWPARTAA